MIEVSRKIVAIGGLAAALTGCSSAGGSLHDGDRTGAATAPAALVTAEPVDVPALRCASAATLGRPDYVLEVRPSSVRPTQGQATLRRYVLVDGQSYVVGMWSVDAESSGDADTGEVALRVADAEGTFALDVAARGDAELAAVNPWGMPLALSLSCAQATTTSGGKPK